MQVADCRLQFAGFQVFITGIMSRPPAYIFVVRFVMSICVIAVVVVIVVVVVIFLYALPTNSTPFRLSRS